MIIYRYLLTQYLTVQLFCVVSFIAILLTTRLKEIAQFATMGAQGGAILWFAFCQIPYILPIAIPVACLISSVVLIQRLSSSNELTALRASGKSLRIILAPILTAAAVIAVLNFYIASELATQSHLATRKLEHELRTINPLFLLQNKHLNKIKGVFVKAESHSGEKATDLIIALWSKQYNRIHLLTAKEMSAVDANLIGKELTFLSTFASATPDQEDNLFTENIQSSTTASEEFSQLLKKNVWHFHNDYLRLPLLWVQVQDQKQQLAQAQQRDEKIQIRKQLNASYSEISRRVSIGLAAFTFTLMGTAFGMSIGRRHSQKGVYYVIGLATLYLVCFFSAKRVEANFLVASALYLLPQFLIIGLSARALYRISRGIE